MKAETGTDDIPPWQNAFLQRHQLGTAYLDTIRDWFNPQVQALAAHQQRTNRPILVALNGCQGCGKTTVADFLCAALAQEHALQAVALSLDDFYLTRVQRQALADAVHPLLITRGVPGTHDMALLGQTLEQLLDPQRGAPVAIPRFNKAVDDRRHPSDWDTIVAPVQVIVLEGWCLGVLPQTPACLVRPLNTLERIEDPSGQWREFSNNIVRREFPPLYAMVDQWIMLRAPSFECVFEWRREQESKLAAMLPPGQSNRLMDDTALHRFIQHYERFTRQCLEMLPDRVNHLFTLNERRQVTSYIHRPQADVPW